MATDKTYGWDKVDLLRLIVRYGEEQQEVGRAAESGADVRERVARAQATQTWQELRALVLGPHVNG